MNHKIRFFQAGLIYADGVRGAPSTSFLCHGIALLELMFATAILGIALITLGVAVGRCVQGLSSADNIQVVVDVAAARLAEWKSAVSGESEIRTGTYDGERIVQNRKFVWHQEVEFSDDPKVLRSTLAIQWREGGREQQRNFVSLVPKSFKAPSSNVQK